MSIRHNESVLWEQVVSGCDGICYRISDNIDFVDKLYLYLLGLNDSTEVYSKEELKIWHLIIKVFACRSLNVEQKK